MSILKKFNDELFKNVISNPTEKELRNLSKHMEKTTEFNSASYVTEVRNRSWCWPKENKQRRSR